MSIYFTFEVNMNKKNNYLGMKVNLKKAKIFYMKTSILTNLKGNSKLAIIWQLNSVLNLSILTNSLRNLISLKSF
jgi:hypothetical protein